MEEAFEAINRLLKHPSDIDDKLETTLRSISSKVETSMSHLDATLKKRMEWFNAIKNHAFEHPGPFPESAKSSESIRLISLAYTNLSLVYSSHRRIKEIDDEIKKFYDSFSGDPDAEGILRAYEMFSSLEDFRHRMYRHKSVSMNKIEKAGLDFVIFVLGLDLLARKDLVKSVGEIVKGEEEKDGITILVKENAQGKVVVPRASKDPGFDVDAAQRSPEYRRELCQMFWYYQNRNVGNLREKIVSGLKSRIKAKVVADYTETLEDMKTLPQSDIGCIFDLDSLVHFYHETLQAYLECYNFTDPGQILKALEFEEQYSKINDENFFALSKIVDTASLTDTYYAISETRITTWMGNMRMQIIDTFLSRDTAPATDEDSKFISFDFINMLELIRNQLEPVKFNNTLYKKVHTHIVGEARFLKVDLVKAMESEFNDAVKLQGRPGYEEYTIMVGNSCLKIAQYAEEDNSLRDIFIDLLKESNALLANFILSTSSVVVHSIFTKDWYEGNTYRLVATIDDFLGDYRVRMTEYTFYTFVLCVIRSLTGCYVRQLMRKRTFIDEDCAYRLRKDHDDLLVVFSKFIEDEEVRKRMEPLRFLAPLLESPSADLFLVEAKALKIRFPDLTKDFIKAVVKKRKDMDDREKEAIRARLGEVFEKKRKKKTFFSKLFSG